METRVRTKIDVDLEDFSDEVAEFIPDLIDSKDHQKKVSARNSLIYMGKSVLPQINALLKSDNYELRIEGARIIQQIRAKESIRTLIRLIEDDESTIRWIAARGLILLGRDSIAPLLVALVKRGKSYYLKSGAHFVLKNLFSEKEKDEYKILLMSLLNVNFIGVIAPVEASKALKSICANN
jgi:HEAT repeat protein